MQDPTADENILKKAADWYGLLSEMSPVGIFFSDPSGHCLDVNRRWCELTGLTPEQTSGREWFHSIHSGDLERVAALWYEAAQNNQPFHAEFRCVTPSGKITRVVGNARPKLAGDGSAEAYIGTITDLGASRQDFDLLRHGGQRIRTIIAHMPVILFAFDQQGLLCAWNHEAERVTGYPAKEIIGNPDAMQLLCPDPDYRRAMLDDYKQRGNDYRDWDWRLTAKDGTVKTISFSNISKYYPLEGWASWGVGVDVTYCRATERELRERVKELTCLYQLSIASNRPNLDLDRFLQEAVDLLPSGFQYPEITRARIIFEDKIFAAEPFRASRWNLSSALNVRGGQVGLIEVYYLEQKPARAEGPFLFEERLLIDEIALQISRTIGHLWARRDLGLLDELAAKNEELEEFSHTISHDLKTPLTAIGGFAQFLHKLVDRGNRAEALSCSERIIEIVGRMENRLNQILMLARIGKVIDPNEKIYFREIAEETIEMLTRRFAEARIAVELDDVFPAVLGHRTRLLEVIEILLDNAIKFIVQPPKRIHIGCRHENDNVVFFVADNGIGIEPQDSETIFQLFQRLDKNSSGEGTGLAIARRIIEAHGGKIWVESDGKDKGACFCFTLGHVFEEDVG